jgi:hypothetical protein
MFGENQGVSDTEIVVGTQSALCVAAPALQDWMKKAGIIVRLQLQRRENLSAGKVAQACDRALCRARSAWCHRGDLLAEEPRPRRTGATPAAHTLGKYLISDKPMTEEDWIKERATVIDVTPGKWGRVPYVEHVPPDVTACTFWLKSIGGATGCHSLGWTQDRERSWQPSPKQVNVTGDPKQIGPVDVGYSP